MQFFILYALESLELIPSRGMCDRVVTGLSTALLSIVDLEGVITTSTATARYEETPYLIFCLQYFYIQKKNFQVFFRQAGLSTVKLKKRYRRGQQEPSEKWSQKTPNSRQLSKSMKRLSMTGWREDPRRLAHVLCLWSNSLLMVVASASKLTSDTSPFIFIGNVNTNH